MRSKFMHWSSILFLKKRANTKLYEKFPSNLKIAKLSVSYSNNFFNLFFNFNLVQKQSTRYAIRHDCFCIAQICCSFIFILHLMRTKLL